LTVMGPGELGAIWVTESWGLLTLRPGVSPFLLLIRVAGAPSPSWVWPSQGSLDPWPPKTTEVWGGGGDSQRNECIARKRLEISPSEIP
jgi:hypothetical protein